MIEYDQMSEQQLEAVNRCANLNPDNKILTISGGAGTGKTSIGRFGYEQCEDAGHTVALAATTGKAARRLSEATGIAAQTVHALLEFPRPGDIDPKTGNPTMQGLPSRNAANKLGQRVVIIDEASMLSKELFMQVCDAMPQGGYLRLIGDHNQLTPIEKNGEDQKDDYQSAFNYWRERNGIVLTQVYRQAEGSGILDNAIRVLRGHMPIQNGDFAMHATYSQRNKVCAIAGQNSIYASTFGQVILPQAKGPNGTHAYNQVLQKLLNPNPAKTTYLERYENSPFAETGLMIGIGDKVIMTKNWYIIEPNGVMNGDLGIVKDILVDGSVIVDFGHSVVELPSVMVVTLPSGREISLTPLRDLDLGYAITTHKAQGSEWEEVIYVIDPMHNAMLCRANTYTAITRAKHKVNFVYKTAALMGAVAVEPLWRKKNKAKGVK